MDDNSIAQALPGSTTAIIIMKHFSALAALLDNLSELQREITMTEEQLFDSENWELLTTQLENELDTATQKRSRLNQTEQLAARIAGIVNDSPCVAVQDPCDQACQEIFLTIFGKVTGKLSVEQISALYQHLAARKEEIWQRIAVYWAVDFHAQVRQDVLRVLLHSAEQHTLSSATAERLAIVQGWLPDEESLEVLDKLIKTSRQGTRQPTQRQGAAGVPSPSRATIDTTHITLPDDLGVQELVIGAHRGSEYLLGGAYVSSAYGFFDVRTFTGLSKADQQELFERRQINSPCGAISFERAVDLLNASLADQFDSGLHPPPGLIDLVHLCGLQDIVAPHPLAARAWLVLIDPDNTLETLTPQKRGRLINRSAKWGEEFPIVDSWIENTSTSQEILNLVGDPANRQRELRRYLDVERRPWWAEQCFRAALALQQESSRDTWMSFAAVGKALLDGRELRKIPMFDNVLETTIDLHNREIAADRPGLWDYQNVATDYGDHQGDEQDIPDSLPEDLSIPLEVRQTLESYYTPERAKGIWESGFYGLHGFLFAIATHPDPPHPTKWLPLLIHSQEESASNAPQKCIATDDKQFLEAINTLFMLYEIINAQVMEGVAELPEGCELRPEATNNFAPDAPIGQWSRGFCVVHQSFGHLVDWLSESAAESFDNQAEREKWEEEVVSLCGFATMALEIFSDRNRVEEVVNIAPQDNPEAGLENMAKFAFECFHESFWDITQLAIAMRSEAIEFEDDGKTLLIHPDYRAAPQQPVRTEKVGRNEPCPCGSGRKYKRCCGDPRQDG